MLTVFRWVLRGFVVSLAVVLLVIGLLYLVVARSVPNYSSTHRVFGIDGPVQIVRDQYGIPHIFGDTDADVFFGLGFVHAQDRLWQMLIFRQAVQGRLSEVFGSRTLATDELMRRLDMNGLAASSYEAQDRETKAALEAYADGVNAWLGAVDDSIFNDGAPELLLFDFEIRPWQPFESIAIMNLQAYELTVHAGNEILRARAGGVLTPQRLEDLMPDVPRMIAPDLTQHAATTAATTLNTRLPANGGISPSTSLFAASLGGASNAWAASPDKSAAGGSLLANDPHLGFSAPSVWMLARLELSTGGVIGATIPGMPAMPVGRSASLGWGVTSSYLDDQDLFIEQLDPDSDSRYLTPEGYKEFRTKNEVINVKGESPVVIELRWTENGPLLPADFHEISDIIPEDHVAALAWTGLDPANTSMSGVLRLMRSATIDQALDSGQLIIAPSLNLMLASKDEIAMQLVGAAPRRHLFHDTRGQLPSQGWKHRNRWQGRIAYAELPRIRNPMSGLLANTNNKIVDRPFPEHISHYWGDSQRIEQLRNLLLQTTVFTRDSFKAIQLDSVSYAARTLIALLGRDSWHTTDRASDDPKINLRNTALSLLRDWNGDMNEHLPEPLIFAAWANAVQKLLTQDDLGELSTAYSRPDPIFIERVFRDVDGASEWCDVRQSTATESCQQIALLALDEALANLRTEFGEDMNAWRWGDAHQARHDHPVLGSFGLLSWFVNIRQSTSGGEFTLNRGSSRAGSDAPFASVHGSGYRGVYDFSEPNASSFIIATGQSGHPMSRHYDDLGRLWRNGEYITMSLDPENARSSSVGITTLEPVN